MLWNRLCGPAATLCHNVGREVAEISLGLDRSFFLVYFDWAIAEVLTALFPVLELIPLLVIFIHDLIFLVSHVAVTRCEILKRVLTIKLC